MFGLGLLGFDHLNLVYVPSSSGAADQDRWFVIEGVRDIDLPSGRRVLGVIGSDGATTLSEANGGRTGGELAHDLGTPEERGGTVIAADGDAIKVWSLMAGAAGDIARSHFPYIAYAPLASPLPTLNSSSLVSSLMFHAGLDYSTHLPPSLRFSPGLSTLIASSGDDHMRLPDSYDAVLGGDGKDTLIGRSDPANPDKLYGGRGNDTLVWSPGRSVMHGGEPGLPYWEDGVDRVSYAGAGPVEIVGHAEAAEHTAPDFTATFAVGQDDLFSIEELVWDDRSDHITVGPGAGLYRSSLSISTYGGDDWIDASTADISLHIDSGEGDDVVIAGAQPLSIFSGPGRDTIVLGTPNAIVEVMDAAREDRISPKWTARAAVIERDADAPGDAVIAVYGEDADPAEVRVHGFTPGMFGICAEPPARVPLDVFDGGINTGDCEGHALIVRHGDDSHLMWAAPDASDSGASLLPSEPDAAGHF